MSACDYRIICRLGVRELLDDLRAMITLGISNQAGSQINQRLARDHSAVSGKPVLDLAF